MFHNLKNSAQYFWVACGAGISALTLYPHTLGLKGFKDKISNHSKEDPEGLILVNEVKNYLGFPQFKFNPKAATLIDIVPTDKLDFVSRGFLSTKWGAVVGVPKFFFLDSIKQANEIEDVLQKYGIDIHTDNGQEILETFKLSEAAKKFALAREISSVNSGNIFVYSIAFGLTVVLSYIVAVALSASIPSTLSFCTIQSILIYVCVKLYDSYNRYFEKCCDIEVANINEEIANGGIEYYKLLLRREQALEKNLFTKEDRLEQYFQTWRKPPLTVSEKLSHLTKAVQEKYGDKTNNGDKTNL